MQHNHSAFFIRSVAALALGCAMIGVAYGDDATGATPAPTKHQLMKECMAKEKAAISGRPNYDLSAECRDITKTEKQNADAADKPDSKPADQTQP